MGTRTSQHSHCTLRPAHRHTPRNSSASHNATRAQGIGVGRSLCHEWRCRALPTGRRAIQSRQNCIGRPRAVLAGGKKKKRARTANRNERSRGRSLLRGHGTYSTSKVGGWRRLAVGGVWRLAAVGGWRFAIGGGWRLAVVGWWRLAVGGGWRFAIGGGCRLAVGGWWRLAVGGGWRFAIGGGWRRTLLQRLAVGGGWRLAVGGWWRLAVRNWWRLAVGGGWWRLVAVGGWRSSGAVLNKKKLWVLQDSPATSPSVSQDETRRPPHATSISSSWDNTRRSTAGPRGGGGHAPAASRAQKHGLGASPPARTPVPVRTRHVHRSGTAGGGGRGLAPPPPPPPAHKMGVAPAYASDGGMACGRPRAMRPLWEGRGARGRGGGPAAKGAVVGTGPRAAMGGVQTHKT